MQQSSPSQNNTPRFKFPSDNQDNQIGYNLPFDNQDNQIDLLNLPSVRSNLISLND